MISSAARSLTAWTRKTGFGAAIGAATGLAVKSKGMPRMSAYSTREELGLRVQLVGLPAQRAADDLLAEKLRAERADAEDVGDGVGVPAFGQHRDGDDAADLPRRAGRRLPTVFMTSRRSVGVGDRSRRLRRRPRAPLLALELLDFGAGELAEAGVERLAGLDLLAVDEQRVRLGQAVAVVVEVAEEFEMAVVDGVGLAVLGSCAGSRRSIRRPASRSRCCCTRR